MTLAVDGRSNSLIVTAAEPLYLEVKELVAEIDRAGLEQVEDVQVVTLKRKNPESVQKVLSSILQTYNIVSLAYLYPTREGLIRTPNETIQEHIDIIEAICRGEPLAAEEAMRHHLQTTAATLNKQILSAKSLRTEVNSR